MSNWFYDLTSDLGDTVGESVASSKLKAKTFGKMFSNNLGALEYLDRPLNAAQGAAAEGLEGAKKGLFNEVDYSYLDAMPLEFQAENPRTAAALATLGEYTLDPTNLVGTGLVKQGTSSLNKVRNYGKGLVSSSFPNYLESFYGLRDEAYEKASSLSKFIGSLVSKSGKTQASTPKQGTAAVEKVRGFVKGMTEGLKNIGGTIVSPEARALWAEQGLNQGAIRIIEERLSKAMTDGGIDLTTSEGKKAIAQAQFHVLALVRAGNKDAIPEVLKRVTDVSFMGGILPFSKDAYKQVIKEQARVVDSITGRKLNTPDKTLDKALDHISEAWGLDLDDPLVSLTIKRATGSGGDHVSDAAWGNPANKYIKEAFEKLDDQDVKITNKNLYETLSNKLSRKSNTKGKKTKAQQEFTLLTTSAEDATENGIWLRSSGKSRSYLEGGISLITHIDKSGRVRVFVSDEQNFLEKVPVVKHFIEGKRGDQPVRSITVSEPIEINLINELPLSGLRADRPSVSNVDKAKQQLSDRKLTVNDFSGLLSAKPSAEALRAARQRVAGEALIGTNMLAPQPEPQQQ